MDARERLAAIPINLSFSETSDKEYQKLQQYQNVTSYSTLDILHACPRKFQLVKARAASGQSGANNVDFAFGHAVGAGVQAWLASGGDMSAAMFNSFMAWRIPFTAEIPAKKKSIAYSWLAVMKYPEFHEQVLDEWHVWKLPNGKPAIELSVSLDFENGYKHYFHIDVILEHNLSGALAIQENKTSGFKSVEEAVYANSAQALSYAVVIDMLADVTSYEVFYCVYSTTSKEWNLLPFSKSTSLKAEWITDARLDQAALTTYKELNFYPKRGESCYDFMRRCEFFGTCNLTSNLVEPKILPPGEEAERVDYSFTLSEVLAKQHKRNETTQEIQPPPRGVHFENID
jgi:hypothetical protein